MPRSLEQAIFSFLKGRLKPTAAVLDDGGSLLWADAERLARYIRKNVVSRSSDAACQVTGNEILIFELEPETYTKES